MSNRITIVIFDLDDTLYDEIEYCKSGFRATAKFLSRIKPACGSADAIYGVFWKAFQEDRTKTFDTALAELGLPVDRKLVQALVHRYRCHRPALTLPEESRKVLNDLSDDYTLALLTDGYLPAQRLKVDALGIQKYFAHIVYSEQLGRPFWKPSPAGYEAIVSATGTLPQSMVYVGDNPIKDFIAPNRLGMKTIQVQRSLRLHRGEPSTADTRAQYYLEALGDLPALLSAWHVQADQEAVGSRPCPRD